jgi:Flp pilus assembly pilin Flp
MIRPRHRARQRPRPRRTAGRSTLVLRAFVVDERGQDVIEYGLLSALFGIVSLVVWISIQGTLRDAYVAYDTDVQELWESPDPVGP